MYLKTVDASYGVADDCYGRGTGIVGIGMATDLNERFDHGSGTLPCFVLFGGNQGPSAC